MFTKELLNRPEVQERIAENINKSLLPGEQKDDSLNEPNEMNNSIVADLSNAIKSIEADPVFEQFLHEIICPVPDEDQASRSPTSAELK